MTKLSVWIARGCGVEPPQFLALRPNSCPRVTAGVNSNLLEGSHSVYCVHTAEDSNNTERGLYSKNDQWFVVVWKKHNSEVSRECFNPSYFLTTQTLTKLDEGRVFKSPPCSSSEGGGSQGTLFLLLILRVEHNLMQKSVNMRYRKVIRTRSNGVISCDLPWPLQVVPVMLMRVLFAIANLLVAFRKRNYRTRKGLSAADACVCCWISFQPSLGQSQKTTTNNKNCHLLSVKRQRVITKSDVSP